MKPNRAGLYRQRVTLQQLATPETFDTFGQPVRTWNTVGTYWAEVRPLQGHEAIVAKQIKAEASHLITMRYLGTSVTLNPTDQFLLGSRVFGVVQVLNAEERNRRYEIIVREVQQTGQV